VIDEHTGKRIVSPLDSPRNLDYRDAYLDMRQVFDNSVIDRALQFAIKIPELVYGAESDEYRRVVHGGYL